LAVLQKPIAGKWMGEQRHVDIFTFIVVLNKPKKIRGLTWRRLMPNYYRVLANGYAGLARAQAANC
jgi:hypothetical protein